jgi:phosphate transport system substrate-binding protein
VPEVNNLPLVLDFETVASIYMSEITMWNDPRIKAINSPEVADALPAQAIVVVTQSISSAITQLLTEMLSATVPRFSTSVRSTTSRAESSLSHSRALSVARWALERWCISRWSRPTAH